MNLQTLIYGEVEFSIDQEYLGFRYKFVTLMMVAGALLTGIFVLATLGNIDPIGEKHLRSMIFFTLSSLTCWFMLRGHPERFLIIAWVYELLSLWEDASSLMFVPSDELRILWFYVNVPGTFILLGKWPGWAVTVGTVLGLAFGNPYLDQPYSANAMGTALLGLLYLGVFSHAYVNRTMSYFSRMRDYNVQLQELATHDALTGVLNARAYYADCQQLIQLSQRSNQLFAVLFVDLDHFKNINDTHGHAAGDEVLRVVAQTLQQHVRRSDVLGRIGGEEFSIFLPDTDLEGALKLAENLRQSIESIDVVLADVHLKITASIGVAIKTYQHQTIKTIQQQADEAMYQAKKEGRNRVSYLQERSNPIG